MIRMVLLALGATGILALLVAAAVDLFDRR